MNSKRRHFIRNFCCEYNELKLRFVFGSLEILDHYRQYEPQAHCWCSCHVSFSPWCDFTTYFLTAHARSPNSPRPSWNSPEVQDDPPACSVAWTMSLIQEERKQSFYMPYIGRCITLGNTKIHIILCLWQFTNYIGNKNTW